MLRTSIYLQNGHDFDINQRYLITNIIKELLMTFWSSLQNMHVEDEDPHPAISQHMLQMLRESNLRLGMVIIFTCGLIIGTMQGSSLISMDSELYMKLRATKMLGSQRCCLMVAGVGDLQGQILL